MSKLRPLLAFLLLLLTPAVLLAEVSRGVSGTIILGAITDDPNPVGVWSQLATDAPNQVLNPDGDERGDGRPDIAWKDNSWPVVVWSYNTGFDMDIALSEWDGSAWTATVFLTVGAVNELDPRVFIEPDGTVHVTWWTAGILDRVWIATRPAGNAFVSLAIPVTGAGETGRRPSVVVHEGSLMVVYERDSTEFGMAQDVVVATDVGGGNFTKELVASTPGTQVLDPVIHSKSGRLWIEWMHDAENFGCVRFGESGWSDVIFEPWTNSGWIGVEEMRRVIRTQMSSDWP